MTRRLAGLRILVAEELDRSGGDVVQALSRYEGRLKPGAAKNQAAGRRSAERPVTQARLLFRDLMLRASSWPFVAPFLRRGLGADSPFRS